MLPQLFRVGSVHRAGGIASGIIKTASIIALLAFNAPVAYGLDYSFSQNIGISSTTLAALIATRTVYVNPIILPTDQNPILLSMHSYLSSALSESPIRQLSSKIVPLKRLGKIDTANSDSALIKYIDGDTDLKLDPSGIKLINGEILVSAVKLTTITTAGVKITMAPGSISLIRNSQHRVNVANLWETKTESVCTDSHDKYTLISAGQQLSVLPDALSLATTTHVSLRQLLHSDDLTRTVVCSSNKTDQALSDKMVKMACIMLLVRAE